MRKLAILWIVTAMATGTGCASLLRWVLDDYPPTPTEPTQPVDPDTPVVKPNKGGDGLYKPESRLWLLPRGIRAPAIFKAFESIDDGGSERYLRIGEHTGPLANGAEYPVADHLAYYHPQDAAGSLKLRDAKVTRDGARLIAIDGTGRIIAEMVVQQRDVRQEGRR